MPITTNVEFENLPRWGVLDTTLCDKVCQWLATGQYFSPGTPVSSTNKTDRHDITEIFLCLRDIDRSFFKFHYLGIVNVKPKYI